MNVKIAEGGVVEDFDLKLDADDVWQGNKVAVVGPAEAVPVDFFADMDTKMAQLSVEAEAIVKAGVIEAERATHFAVNPPAPRAPRHVGDDERVLAKRRAKARAKRKAQRQARKASRR